MVGTCECGNEPLDSIKCGEFLDQLKNRLTSQERLCSMDDITIIMSLETIK